MSVSTADDNSQVIRGLSDRRLAGCDWSAVSTGGGDLMSGSLAQCADQPASRAPPGTVASQTPGREDITETSLRHHSLPVLTTITVGRKRGEKAENENCVYFQK